MLVCALLDGLVPRRPRHLLVGALGVGLVLSHYSSTYVAISAVVIALLLQAAVRRFCDVRLVSRSLRLAAIVLIGGAAIWCGAVTHSASNLTSFSSALANKGLDLLPNSNGNILSGYPNGSFARAASAQTWDCVTTNDVDTVTQWSKVLGRRIDCAVVFVNATATWSDWQDPWIIRYRKNWPRFDWVDWYRRYRQRRLVVTQSLIPSGLRGTDWLTPGAQGAFMPYARAFARALVRAGMGTAVIRLGHEANGDWYADSIPNTRDGDRKWVQTWRNTVVAMKSVRGAKFTFDWTVNAGYRNVRLSSFYPGNHVVDVIGVDAYDKLIGGANRLQSLLSQPDGLLAVRSFARMHHKPMSIPEWGIEPRGQEQGAGDDPRYVDAIATLAREGGVLYQSYFTAASSGRELLTAPRSLAAYRRHFGAGGDVTTP